MISSMSHGNRWCRVSSSFSTRFVCTRTSFSSNVWWNLFLLLESIHPSIDQQCSHSDAENMTTETLYTNQTSSLNMGSAFVGHTINKCFYPNCSKKFHHFTGWKHHDHHPSPHHQNDHVHTMLSVEFDKVTVMSTLMSWRYWHSVRHTPASRRWVELEMSYHGKYTELNSSKLTETRDGMNKECETWMEKAKMFIEEFPLT